MRDSREAASCPRVTSCSILPGCLSRKRRRTEGNDFYHVPQHRKPEHICEIHFSPNFPFNLGQLATWAKIIHREIDEFDKEEALQAKRKDRRQPAPFYLESPMGFTFT